MTCILCQAIYSWLLPESFGCIHTTKNSFRHRPHYSEEIRKRRFHSENASNVFRPHYAGEIRKRNNHRSFCICVWGKLGQGNQMIIVTPSFSKSSVFKMFSIYTKKREAGVFKFLQFEERFRKAPPWWRIRVDGKPNCRNKAAFWNSSCVVGTGRYFHCCDNNV